jgi:uroporphyrin-III C-methyltransferase
MQEDIGASRSASQRRPPASEEGTTGNSVVGKAAEATSSTASGQQAATDCPGAGGVSLVGSGPGHPELLTRRAWHRLEEADVVLYDSLTGDAVVDALPAGAEAIDVGKRPPNRTSQDEINELMSTRADGGEYVVRLKGGDPNVFGRGGEEAEYLAAEAVPFEVVPGISSVLAAASVSGIPLTHRHCSSSLTVITGHQTPDKEDSAIDWPAIADSLDAGGTLVILMGVSKLDENVSALREHGVSEETPVAMIEDVSLDSERTISGTLGTVVDRSEEADIEPPAVTIVGEVVAHGDDVSEMLQ